RDLFEAYAGQIRRQVAYPWRAATSEAPALGWTSWYRYFNRLAYADLTRDLEAVAQSDLPFRYFQIDDGWQREVGDWRDTRPEMQPGMADLARRIREAGLKPGIWFAPFVASRRSVLARQHPDWLLRDAGGRPVKAGWNPLWGGDFYALDISRPALREYLSGCLHIAADRWGYDFFKLDFLYAAALRPEPERTRAQIMSEALEFLYAQLPRQTILACGVPLGAGWGRCEYLRVSGDTHLSWRHRAASWIGHRERPDTLAALHTNLTRWGLGRGAWGHDPDVFVLRDHAQKLTPVQRQTLLSVNALLGDLLFCSDDLNAYSPAQQSMLREALALQKATVERVTPLGPELYRIDYQIEREKFMMLVNLSGRVVRLAEATLSPYETLTLRRS
ncbi:MAG: glycoside hydrolase family 36 protein, partial [Saprospiraceae bacterium]